MPGDINPGGQCFAEIRIKILVPRGARVLLRLQEQDGMRSMTDEGQCR
jgi:hypothetical protein